MTAFALDLRHALRAFARAPGFTVAAVLSLAIGIGANTTIFSVASALLLRPLPYADADRLCILWNTSPGLGINEDWFSTAQYFDIKASIRSFEDVAVAIGGNANLTGDGRPERVGTLRVSSNLLPMLGAQPELGDLFRPGDDTPGTTGAAVLGHATWVRRYGGDPSVVGRAIVLDGKPYEVRGVLPASFDVPREVMPTLGGAEHAEILVPLPLAAEAASVRNGEDYNILARLRRDASLDQARAELRTLAARLVRAHPDFYPPNGGLAFVALPLQEQVVGNVRRSLVVLTGAVACVLLIACANVAGLLLSRALGRQREVAVRAALGASRVRIVRQLLTESVLLASAGGAAGLGLAAAGLQGVRLLGTRSVPRLHEIGLDGSVVLFTAIVSVAAGVLFGIAPAVRLSRLDSNALLKDAARGSSGAGAVWSRRHHLRRLLVIGELALAVLLLVAAGLLLRSFSYLQRVPPGFDASQVLTFELTLTGERYTQPATVLETYRLLWERLRAVPGVTAAGGVTALPLSRMMAWGPITVEDRVPAAGERFINADQRTVSGDYFRAMTIRLIKGRLFTDDDVAATPRVIVIDEHMARQLWPGDDPIGKRVRTGGFDVTATTPWLTVVGVVGRVKQDALDSEPRIAFYRPHRQSAARALTVVVRSGADPAGLAASIRAQLAALDPDLPIYRVRTMEERVGESLAERRFAMLLLTVFAAVALGLAALGTYGVIATLVSQGTREIGIRMALGATTGRILAMIVGDGMTLAVIGIGVGLAAAAWLTGFMRSLLFGVEPTDPLTFAAIGLLLVSIAVLASYVPARRAARLDPMTSLRSE